MSVLIQLSANGGGYSESDRLFLFRFLFLTVRKQPSRDRWFQVLRKGDKCQAQANGAKRWLPLHNNDWPHQSLQRVHHGINREAKNKLDQLFAEKSTDAFALNEFAGDSSDFEIDERKYEPARVKTTTADFPDFREPAAKPPVRFVQQLRLLFVDSSESCALKRQVRHQA